MSVAVTIDSAEIRASQAPVKAKNAKVIAFDSWTEGAGNIERLVEAFGRYDLELLLIHVGSWGHDLNRPKEECIGKLNVRDISYYKGRSLLEVLKLESPSVVVFLSTTAYIHRAVNRYCRQLGIPTLHLYHGLVNVQDTASKRLNPLNVRRQLELIISRVGKNLVRTIPVYAKSLWDTRATLCEWGRFGYDLWLQIASRSYVGRAAADASTTACSVYTSADVMHAVHRYRMSNESVFTVGNPDLVKFGIKEQDIGIGLSPSRSNTSEIIYIDTALIEAGAVFVSAEDFVAHLRMTRDALAKANYQLIVKLHPVHVRTGVPELLEKHGIPECKAEEFLPRLKKCCAAIVEPSSAATLPALLGLPLFLAQHGKLSAQAYGKVLTTYPRSEMLTSLETLSDLLIASRNVSTPDVWSWIKENAGPLPAEMMPERVAKIIINLLSKRQEIVS